MNHLYYGHRIIGVWVFVPTLTQPIRKYADSNWRRWLLPSYVINLILRRVSDRGGSSYDFFSPVGCPAAAPRKKPCLAIKARHGLSAIGRDVGSA